MEGPPKKKENLDTGQRWRRAINATILNSRSTLETTHDSPMPISASSSIRPSGAPLSSENIRPSEPPRQRSSSGSEVYEAPILRALDMPMPPKKVGSGKKKPSGGSGKKPPAGVTSNPLLPVKIAPKPPTNAAALNFQSSTVKLLAKFSPEATPAASSSTWTLSDGQTTRSWTVFSTDSAAYSARPPLPGSATARKIMGNEQSKQDFVESEDEDNEIPTKKVNPSKQTNQRDKLPETTLREYKSPYASPPKNSASASTVKSALAAVPARGRSPLKRKASSELPARFSYPTTPRKAQAR
ncbi:hypothetical protein G7Y89_g12767 [Cudoniella acicularis]|uniref:Uncharacterized protein n=1 Tax=Cudoniella acicularis TaxID=354080 RepID=A0A8H4RAL3_9HELO|nr:hypothetical protein G7Y89_g12767 [Cudoniella acicularis]